MDIIKRSLTLRMRKAIPFLPVSISIACRREIMFLRRRCCWWN